MVIATFVLYITGVIPYRIFVVHTGSMDPTIPSGSAAIVRVGEYQVGQPVTFDIHGTTVTHRLVAINAEDGTITTKGDANRSVDPWHAPVSNITGGVVATPRYLGFLLVFLFKTTGGLGVLLFAACIWQCFGFARTFADEPQPKEKALQPVP